MLSNSKKLFSKKKKINGHYTAFYECDFHTKFKKGYALESLIYKVFLGFTTIGKHKPICVKKL